MAYVTAAQLADGAEAASELSELYGVDAALLTAVIAGGDTSSWPPAEVASASIALASIERFALQADSEIDARLVVRGYTLPLSAVQFPLLAVWARAIARYNLHRQRDRTNEETGRIERDYRETIRCLDLVAEGRMGIGAGDPLAPAPVDPNDPKTGAVRINSQPRKFSRNTLEGL